MLVETTLATLTMTAMTMTAMTMTTMSITKMMTINGNDDTENKWLLLSQVEAYPQALTLSYHSCPFPLLNPFKKKMCITRVMTKSGTKSTLKVVLMVTLTVIQTRVVLMTMTMKVNSQ